MQKIWFISDYHFNHLGVLNWRKQFSSIEEMNESIISLHNSTIKPADIVYHLGDFIWKGKAETILDRLNGYFYIIKGNHDRTINFNHKKVQHALDGFYNIKIQKQDITLCHFPMVTWNRSHWNSWHLYGHHHSPLPERFDIGKRLNVNFDVIKRPIEFDELKDVMSKKENNWDYIERA